MTVKGSRVADPEILSEIQGLIDYNWEPELKDFKQWVRENNIDSDTAQDSMLARLARLSAWLDYSHWEGEGPVGFIERLRLEALEGY